MGLSATRTIRFDKGLDEALQTIGRNQKMSVNAIVNKLVREYVEWDRYNEKIHIMEVSPTLLTELMERCSLDDARELGRRMSQDLVRPSIEQMFVDFTFDNAVEFLRRFSLYTKRFDFEDSVEGRRHLIMLRHSLGPKWSAYYGGMLSDILEKGLRIKIEQTIGPETSSARFEL
ncbi:MAG: hypothetical protein ABSA72_10245 [Nitrososphaerales archaeon]|jgi:hypothetical protein